MPDRPRKLAFIIPARNEAAAIGGVVASLAGFGGEIIVVDNGSTDGTGARARSAGARVVTEPTAGYGRACLAGIAAAHDADILVFIDADAADDPADLPALLQPILDGRAAFVVGSRLAGAVEAGALTLPQRVGNALATFLMRRLWGGAFTDLGPFRAITAAAYRRLGMTSTAYGWTVEMQVRALRFGVPSLEVPVRYRRRIGVSKISGTVRGVALAGATILGVIAREALFRPRPEPLDGWDHGRYEGRLTPGNSHANRPHPKQPDARSRG